MPVPTNPWDLDSGHNLRSQVLDHTLAFAPKSVPEHSRNQDLNSDHNLHPHTLNHMPAIAPKSVSGTVQSLGP